ncbi:MAG: hypothetical protein ACLTF6_16155 [Clostridium sp.]
MNEVFETVAEVLEELRSEAEEREYSVHTNESENADKALKKANREYETVLAELSAEHREFFENYMDIETVAEVLEELRSEAEEREYSVHTNESENADKALKKANREYETVLAELSAEHREFFENYMDIVDHAHFQEEQRAYYQGMVDVMQIFDGLGILKERNKVKEVLMHIKE